MFEAAVSKFVKSVGKESLVGVPNLDEANMCRPLQVVIKKNRRWLWQSAKYEPTPFSLHQLLTDESEFQDVKLTSRELTVYNKTYKFNIDGKIGGTLKKLLDVEVSGSDSINVEAKFNTITKVEADVPALMDSLTKRKLKQSHEFVEQVKKDWRKVLCVITGTAQVSADAAVHMHVEWKGETKADVDPANTGADAHINGNGDKTLTVPKDTPIAYNLCELYINSQGELELMVEDETSGGFEATSDEPDGQIEKEMRRNISLEEQYGALVDLPSGKREEFRNAVLEVCATPKDIPVILKLLRRMAKNAKAGELTKAENPEEERVLSTATTIATIARPTDKDEDIPYEAVISVFEALIELDDDETLALRSINAPHAKSLLYILHQKLEGEEISLKDREVAALYDAPNPGQVFLQHLGFQISEQNILVDADDNSHELEGAYCAVYALWFDRSEAERVEKSSCAIL